MVKKLGYNERLFDSGFRKWLHEARFLWLERVSRDFDINTRNVLELGCFDGRAIEYLVKKPGHYCGIDANWEGGIDLAKERYGDLANYQFLIVKSPSELNPVNEKYSLAISLETLEHIPPDILDEYLMYISNSLEGVFAVSVPNEKGILFLAKYLAKKMVFGGSETYTFGEVINATLGRLQYVSRLEHKGFDWEKLLEQLSDYFVVEKVEGIQFRWAPLFCNAQIGFILRSKIS